LTPKGNFKTDSVRNAIEKHVFWKNFKKKSSRKIRRIPKAAESHMEAGTDQNSGIAVQTGKTRRLYGFLSRDLGSRDTWGIPLEFRRQQKAKNA
jgi:hypothetical protein